MTPKPELTKREVDELPVSLAVHYFAPPRPQKLTLPHFLRQLDVLIHRPHILVTGDPHLHFQSYTFLQRNSHKSPPYFMRCDQLVLGTTF